MVLTKNILKYLSFEKPPHHVHHKFRHILLKKSALKRRKMYANLLNNCMDNNEKFISALKDIPMQTLLYTKNELKLYSDFYTKAINAEIQRRQYDQIKRINS